MLTDNGAIYTARYRGGKVVMETLTRIARCHLQTLKPVPPPDLRQGRTLPPDAQEVPRQTTRRAHSPNSKTTSTASSAYYNHQRPHRALRRRTPHEASSTPKSKPTQPRTITAAHFRVRHDKVDKHGSITIRYNSRLHHIGMGARLNGQPVVMLIADRDIRIVSPDGELLRRLSLDPTRDYQPQTLGWISTMS